MNAERADRPEARAADELRARAVEVLGRWPADSLRADLLKVGHHGSRTSTSPEWLTAAGPHLAVISVGASNRYGHPHPSILARLDSVGVPRVWRTDRDGTVTVTVLDSSMLLRGRRATRQYPLRP